MTVSTKVRTGLDQLSDHPIAERLASSRVAVLAHHASVDASLRHLVTILQKMLAQKSYDFSVPSMVYGPHIKTWKLSVTSATPGSMFRYSVCMATELKVFYRPMVL
jgi:hypothetical protein